MAKFIVELELDPETAQGIVEELRSYVFSRRLPALDAFYTQLRDKVQAEHTRRERSPRITFDNFETYLTAYRNEGFDDPELEVELYAFAEARNLLLHLSRQEHLRYDLLKERGSL